MTSPEIGGRPAEAYGDAASVFRADVRVTQDRSGMVMNVPTGAGPASEILAVFTPPTPKPDASSDLRGGDSSPINQLPGSTSTPVRKDTLYTSPFDPFVNKGTNAADEWDEWPGISARDRSYTGSLGSLLHDLHSATTSDSVESQVKAVLHPPRLINAFVNWNIDHPDRPQHLLTRRATDTALAVYQGLPDAPEMVAALRDQVRRDAPEIQGVAIEERADSDRWMATFPGYSYGTADQLHEKLNGQPVLLIAIANGGTAAGMDVINRYTSLEPGNDNIFSAMRYSARKLIDTEPKVSAADSEYLRRQSEGREIVLFDELSASGTTLKTAAAFMKNKVFAGKNITTATNVLGEIDDYQPDVAGYLY